MRILDMKLVGRNFYDLSNANVLQRYRWVRDVLCFGCCCSGATPVLLPAAVGSKGFPGTLRGMAGSCPGRCTHPSACGCESEAFAKGDALPQCQQGDSLAVGVAVGVAVLRCRG